MSDVLIRKTGRAGRITLNRPKALNALTWDMCLKIERALDAWRDDDQVALVVIDAEGDRAFCAGGDIAEMYRTGTSRDFGYGRRFWSDEYRLNAKIAEYPKPYVAFCQGYTMGGGVGVSCHGSHRIVCENSRIAMPEVGIGLIPDVGGTWLLSRAPGRLGEYLGTTAFRMSPQDAIHAGFADTYIPRETWPDLIDTLERGGDVTTIDAADTPPPEGVLAGHADWIDRTFAGATLGDVMRALATDEGPLADDTRKAIGRASPLAAACAFAAIGRVRGMGDLRAALETEYRFTFRAMEHGDFLEGIRAAIIDKDGSPKWRHASVEEVAAVDVAQMLMPLGDDRLRFEEENA